MSNIKKDNPIKKKCVPCEGGMPRLTRGEALIFLKATDGWKLSKGVSSIQRFFVMRDFSAAVRLINAIAKLAQKEDHHPDIHLTGYRKLSIELSTHAIGGLSENDFILAAKIDALPKFIKK